MRKNGRSTGCKLAAVSWIIIAAGCGTTVARAGGGNDESRQTNRAASAPMPVVEILSWDQTQKRREQLRDKVVVLDVWSTYCDPCVREFPNLVALQKRFGDKVVCISFDTDYSGAKEAPPESFREPVLKFLAGHHAFLFNVISSDSSEEFYDRIRLGGPPAVFVYDRRGKLVRRFDNSRVPKIPEFSYQRDVVPLVEKLLAGAK